MTAPGDCRNCRDYRGCPGKEWFNFSEIRWCVWQVVWIITHKEILRSGRWPQDPYGSDAANPRHGNIATEASFVKPEIVIAELEERLRRVGPQAELLICQIEDGRSFSNLSSGAREVLMYAKGFRRKTMTFGEWRKQSRYRQSMTTKPHHSCPK